MASLGVSQCSKICTKCIRTLCLLNSLEKVTILLTVIIAVSQTFYFSYDIIKRAFKTGLTPLAQGWWGGGWNALRARQIHRREKKRGEERKKERKKKKIK